VVWEGRRREAPPYPDQCTLSCAQHKVHSRRKFFDIAELSKAPIALEAVKRIDGVFAVEREISGLDPKSVSPCCRR
jgi:hypothetical protein